MPKIILIIILCIAIVFSYDYLQNCLEERKALPFTSRSDALILSRKEILLEDKDDFSFEDYFTILDFAEHRFHYLIDDENVTIYLNGTQYRYPYHIQEKEKEIVEVTVYKEIYHTSNDEKSEENKEESTNVADTVTSEDEHYLHLHRNSFSYPIGTDLNRIISDLSSCFESNANVLIDFSRINASASGSYPVYFNYDDKQKEVIVNIS